MFLATKMIYKIVLSLVLVTNTSIGYAGGKSLAEKSITLTEYKDSKLNKNLGSEFNTIYGSEEICNQKESSIRWSNVESDLEKYGIGMSKVNWLFSSDSCTKVIDPKFNYITIRELRDKNTSLYVYYIHHTQENKRILVKIIRNNSIQPMSQGKRKYFGDVETFPDGKFFLDQYINSKNTFY